MSDTAQPTTGLAHRFVDDPHSVIGALIKRGAGGRTVPAAVPQSAALTQSTPQSQTTHALDVLEQVISETESGALPQNASATPANLPLDLTSQGVLSQVMPRVMQQTADSLDPSARAVSAASRKESAADTVSLDQVAADAARGVQQAETEPSVEISPEVESYLQKVEENKDMAPKEIVIADQSGTQPADHQYPSQPVVVLPISPDEEKAGLKKSPKFSIRWLVEWSRKLMKMFVGKVIYRPAEGAAA